MWSLIFDKLCQSCGIISTRYWPDIDLTSVSVCSSHTCPHEHISICSYLHRQTRWIVSSSPLSCSCGGSTHITSERLMSHWATWPRSPNGIKIRHTHVHDSFSKKEATSKPLSVTSSNSADCNLSAMCECVLGALAGWRGSLRVGAMNWTLVYLLQFPELIWESVWAKPQVTAAGHSSGTHCNSHA